MSKLIKISTSKNFNSILNQAINKKCILNMLTAQVAVHGKGRAGSSTLLF